MNPVILVGLIVAAWLAITVIAGTTVGTAIRFLRGDEYWDDRARAELVEEET